MFTDPPVTRPVKPVYREAHPALSIVGVRRAWRDRLHVAEWFNERSEFVARMEVLLWSDEALRFHYEWMDGTKRLERVVELEVLHRPTVTNRRLPDALCHGCRRVKPKLYLMGGEWKCAGCHGLVSRATLLTPAETKLLQARRLHTAVHERRMPTRGFRTWDHNRLKLMRLMETLEKLGVTALREHLRAQVRGGWVDALDDPEEASALTALDYRSPAPKPRMVSPWFG